MTRERDMPDDLIHGTIESWVFERPEDKVVEIYVRDKTYQLHREVPYDQRLDYTGRAAVGLIKENVDDMVAILKNPYERMSL